MIDYFFLLMVILMAEQKFYTCLVNTMTIISGIQIIEFVHTICLVSIIGLR